MRYLLVGIAGIIGALLRYLIGVYFNQWWVYDFPMSTFITNIIGCFILGWLTTFLPRLNFLHHNLKTALGTGLIGSFTTFSTFSVETVHLFMNSKWGIALFYILLSLLGGIIFCWIGFRMGEKNQEEARED